MIIRARPVLRVGNLQALDARSKDLADRRKTADKAIKQAIANLNKTFG